MPSRSMGIDGHRKGKKGGGKGGEGGGGVGTCRQF
jgi:hypothetical protein